MSTHVKSKSVLILVAGAKGAVGSTLAAAIAALRKKTGPVASALTTADKFTACLPLEKTLMAGWDSRDVPLADALKASGVLPENIRKPVADEISRLPILTAPDTRLGLTARVDRLCEDIRAFGRQFPGAQPVLVNLLPAARPPDLSACKNIRQVYTAAERSEFADLAYALAAIRSGIPLANFTPNEIEFPAITAEAEKQRVPLAGRDGKTGQTYLKVALASALKARRLTVDGWYSLNILGNPDGANLMDPDKAAGKISNKTRLLDDILGYPVGSGYDAPTHKVHIDYYPPRGDAKEAWDVIDFYGLFGLPMSIRLNLIGRDSILAAPLALDLARWLAALKTAGYAGAVPELGFYFKKPVGRKPPLTFQDQVAALAALETACHRKEIS